jgi:hypothetical protein
VLNYADAASDKVHANVRSPHFWPIAAVRGTQDCHSPEDPELLARGAPLIQAKAFAFVITGLDEYAADVRVHLLELTATNGYGDSYSGANQCILNLSWYLSSWIIAADILEEYKGWSSADKFAFQRWLATEAYKKTDWASDAKMNNWGMAGSATSAMIADYLSLSGLKLIDREGHALSPAEAFREAKQRQLDRMNGNAYMKTTGCPQNQGEGIRSDGGIPWELGRGSAQCNGRWITQSDKSWTYTITAITAIVQHAELLWRRGDNSIYENMTAAGSGSLLKAIHFLIHNPNDPSKSLPWKENKKNALEFANYYFTATGHPDPYLASELRLRKKDRFVGGENGRMLHFGTLTHGFAVNEVPSAPPAVLPPAD